MNPPPELPVYTAIFQRCDLEGTGEIQPGAVKELFSTAVGLERQHLREIWTLVNVHNRPTLNRGEFFTALRLISIVQAGHAATMENINKFAIGSVQLPFPAFESQLGGAAPMMAAPSGPSPADLWAVTPQERQAWLSVFHQHESGGSMSGAAVAPLFYQILGLEKKKALRAIWTLADNDHDGVLNAAEFVAAMCLIDRHKNRNAALPATLPIALLPANQPLDASVGSGFGGDDAFASMGAGFGAGSSGALPSMAQPSSVVEPSGADSGFGGFDASPAMAPADSGFGDDAFTGMGGDGGGGGMGGGDADAFGGFDASPMGMAATAGGAGAGFGDFADDAFAGVGGGGGGGTGAGDDEDAWGALPPMASAVPPLQAQPRMQMQVGVTPAGTPPQMQQGGTPPQTQLMLPTGNGPRGGASSLAAEQMVVADMQNAVVQVSFLLCTVTFYPNLAHNLTRSP
jgi:hypothetical protein